MHHGSYDANCGAINRTQARELITDRPLYTEIVVIRVANGTALTNFILQPQIEKGTTATSWEKYVGGTASPNPDYPQAVKVVTGNNNVVISNRNLNSNGNTFTPTQVTWYDNYGTATSSVADLQANSNYIDLKGGQAYTFKINDYDNIDRYQIVYIANNTVNALAQASSNITNAKKFTPTADMRIWVRYRNVNANTSTYIHAQLEKGPTATTYVAHQGATYPLSLGSIELAKIGTYQDYITGTIDNWKVVKNVTKHILWDISQVRGPTDIFGEQKKYVVYDVNDIYQLNTKNYYFKCDRVSPSNGVATNYTGYLVGTNFVVIVGDNDTTDIVNSKLKNANMYARRAVAEETAITDTTLISQLNAIYNARSYSGQTNITSTYANEQMDISATALTQMGV